MDKYKVNTQDNGYTVGVPYSDHGILVEILTDSINRYEEVAEEIQGLIDKLPPSVAADRIKQGWEYQIKCINRKKETAVKFLESIYDV